MTAVSAAAPVAYDSLLMRRLLVLAIRLPSVGARKEIAQHANAPDAGRAYRKGRAGMTPWPTKKPAQRLDALPHAKTRNPAQRLDALAHAKTPEPGDFLKALLPKEMFANYVKVKEMEIRKYMHQVTELEHDMYWFV